MGLQRQYYNLLKRLIGKVNISFGLVMFRAVPEPFLHLSIMHIHDMDKKQTKKTTFL